MRFDTPVFFRRVIPGKYDTTTGDYKPDKIQEERRLASVTNSGTETMQIVYGSIKQGSLTVRLQNHYKEPFDNIRIGDKVYQVDMSRKLPVKHTFVVSEVQ